MRAADVAARPRQSEAGGRVATERTLCRDSCPFPSPPSLLLPRRSAWAWRTRGTWSQMPWPPWTRCSPPLGRPLLSRRASPTLALRHSGPAFHRGRKGRTLQCSARAARPLSLRVRASPSPRSSRQPEGCLASCQFGGAASWVHCGPLHAPNIPMLPRTLARVVFVIAYQRDDVRCGARRLGSRHLIFTPSVAQC